VSALDADRRTFLRRLAILGVGVAGFVFVRQQVNWPTPKILLAEGRSSGWLPTPRDGGLIALPARIGRADIQAVVDSGAQYSAIDAGLAEQLRLPAATPLPMVAFGVSGQPSVTQAVRLDALLGPARGAVGVRGLRAATLNLQPLSGLTRQPFSLLLGRDFLHAVVLEADFPRRRVAFFDPDGWSPPAGARAAPMRLESGGPMAPVRIEDSPPIEVMVDTGATGALALSEASARAAGLFDGRPMRVGQSVTLGGVSQDGMVRARRLEFAGHTLEDLDVQVYRPAANAPVPDGLLGVGVLGRFHMALDLPGGRLFLIGPEHPGRPPTPEPPTRFG